jgi:Flp pilus assembly protein TadG
MARVMSSRNFPTSSVLAAFVRHRLTRLRRPRRGQAMVEFALVLTLALIVLFVSVQLALIGECALALGQMNYQGARYAAVHPCNALADVAEYMVSIGSPSITKNCGGNLKIGMILTHNNSDGTTTTTPYTAVKPSCGTPACSDCTTAGCTLNRNFGDKIEVDLTYDVSDNLFLPNTGGGFFGITFPTTLKHSETAIVE